jgi:DNA polymerase I-like protein with 3'-5' exonuclease and polymerase domains
MVSTKTGRLSCNKPNIQNQTTEGGIKDAYVSRYGDDGVLVEFDYSQLEMAGLAFVSGDKQLTEDINNNIDMHNELYKGMYGRYPTKEERKPFKRLSFGLVYGAGAKTLSEQAGCSIEDSKKFIYVFYMRYVGVRKFHEDIQEEAKCKRRVIAEHTPKGFPRHAFLKKMPTGRMYIFKEYDNEWKREPSFSPTELKNWPVQGFSTGDVVPHMVGTVVKFIYTHDVDAVPIMTVHDSMLFDVPKNKLSDVVTTLRTILNSTTTLFNDFFGTSLDVKLSTGCSVGKTWGTLKEI